MPTGEFNPLSGFVNRRLPLYRLAPLVEVVPPSPVASILTMLIRQKAALRFHEAHH
jgi:hypothetical protein